MKVKRLANAAGVALPLDAAFAAESLDGAEGIDGGGGGEPGRVLDEDDEGLDLDDFIQQMMENGGGAEVLAPEDLAQLPLAVVPSEQQHQFFTGPLPQAQASQQSAVGGVTVQANGYADHYRYHGNYGGQAAAGALLPSLVPASQQQQFSLQPAAPGSGASIPAIFPLSGPQSLTSDFLQQQPAQVSLQQQQQQQPPTSGIRAAINLRKRPLQQQQLQDLPESPDFALEAKPNVPLLQQQQKQQSSVGGDSTTSTTDAGGGDSAMDDRSERKRLKNAQLARENREKKKQHVQELETRVSELETALAGSRDREASLSSELSSAKRHNNYLLSVLYRQSELAAFLSTVPALVSRGRRLQLQPQAMTRDTDSQTTTGGICLHLDSAETVSVLLCDKCASLGGGGTGGAVLTGPASQPSSLSSNPQQQSM